MTPFQDNTTQAAFDFTVPAPEAGRTASGAKSRPYIYSPICECGVKKDRRSERCKDCQYIFDKRPRRDEDPNVYIYGDGDTEERCRKIPLTNNQWAVVSEIDYPELIKHNWIGWWNIKTHSYYATRGEKRGGKRYTILMHNSVYIAAHGSIPAGRKVDHISVDSLENRRGNFRDVSNHENMFNSGKRRNNTSGYKGVTKQIRRGVWTGKWIAQIRAYDQHYSLGVFDTREEEYEAYCESARRLHGQYARLV